MTRTLRAALLLPIIVLLLTLTSVSQARTLQSIAPLRDPHYVDVYPTDFVVVHDPAPQASQAELYLENYEFQFRTFSITEAGSACGDGVELPWISAQPASGGIPREGIRTVILTFDSTGLPNGTYTGLLCVTTNDPDTPLVIVTVALRVGAKATPTFTPEPPTAIPTDTPIPPTETAEPPTVTPELPTPTVEQPTATAEPPTPTVEPQPPTLTPEAPPATNTPPSGATFTPTQTIPEATSTPTTAPAGFHIYLPLARRR